MEAIDLRSDTLTRPTAGMREVMAGAEVGDDVFGEDPTINTLQEQVADLMGKERALFVPSGTMGNQLGIHAHTQPGDEVICEADCHCFNYEGGAPALLSGVQLHPLPGTNGVITPDQIQPALRRDDPHHPVSRLVTLENTHNRAGGAIFPYEAMKAVSVFCRERGLSIHLDGARLFNAHIASGISLQDYGDCVDSVSLCFSKGLGAPVGSILVGSEDVIRRAHRFRKKLGGGMRQAGILAAAALYALEHHVERLREDHRRARQLAEFLNTCEGVHVDLEATQTNIVIADCSSRSESAIQLVDEMKQLGLYCLPISDTRIRWVMHLDVDDDQLDRALSILGSVFGGRDRPEKT
jgi:threonine aldolase